MSERIKTAYEIRRQQILEQLDRGAGSYYAIRDLEIELEQINKRLNPNTIEAYSELLRRGKQ